MRGDSVEGAWSFGAFLRRERLRAGLTQEELAELAGLSLRGVSDLERGARRTPYPETVRRLADALQLDAAQRSRLLAAARQTAAPGTAEAPRSPPLPVALTSFVGRERELADVRRLLGTTRLLTLTGSGGIGKTRLALEVAAGLQAEGLSEVALVELAALEAPGHVPGAVAASLGIRVPPSQEPVAALVDALRPRRLLLVLDNCEQLARACAELAERLVRTCPMLTVLVTSREVLGIGGETTWRVPPLSLLSPADAVDVDRLARTEAVQLFTARAAAACPDFALTERNATLVAQLCWRLDGIPLALELAAARLRVLSLQDVADRLDDALRLLTGGSRGAAPRQQTLRGTLDWSHQLLSAAEQALFCRLAVFAGTWTLAAAEAVCSDAPLTRDDVLDVLGQLVDKSLVLLKLDAAGEGRYRLLETVRQYAQDHLHASGDECEVRTRHAAYFSELAARAQPELWGQTLGDWRLTFSNDYDNFRAALRWLIERGDVAVAQRLGAVLARFWQMGTYLHEGRAWLAELLELPSASQPERAHVLLGAGLLAFYQADYATAVAYLEDGARVCRAIHDDAGLAQALFTLGLLTWARGDVARARALADAGLEAGRRAGHTALQSLNLFVGAVAAMDATEYATARALAEDAFRLASEAGYARGMAMARAALGGTSYWQGEPAAACALLEEALALFRRAEFPVGVAWALGLLGQATAALGDTQQATRLLVESSGLVQQLGMQAWLPALLDGLAEVAALEADPRTAVRLAGAAAGLRQRQDFPIMPAARAHLERWLPRTRAGLGAAGAAEWATGLALTPAEAVRWALERHRTAAQSSRTDRQQRRTGDSH